MTSYPHAAVASLTADEVVDLYFRHPDSDKYLISKDGIILRWGNDLEVREGKTFSLLARRSGNAYHVRVVSDSANSTPVWLLKRRIETYVDRTGYEPTKSIQIGTSTYTCWRNLKREEEDRERRRSEREARLLGAPSQYVGGAIPVSVSTDNGGLVRVALNSGEVFEYRGDPARPPHVEFEVGYDDDVFGAGLERVQQHVKATVRFSLSTQRHSTGGEEVKK